MTEFIKQYQRLGGTKIVKQYLKAGVLPYAIFGVLYLGFSKCSLEILRLAIGNKIKRKLRRKYGYAIDDFKKNEKGAYTQRRSNKVWFCWFQGLDSAPPLVVECYESLKRNLKDKELVLLTDENIFDYVEFPKHIKEKYDNGTITRTHFSDLLRLELLINHGGTWIDATVLCTGSVVPDYMLDSDLFVFQNIKPGKDGHATYISSWFMTSCTNNRILLLTRHLLYEYWKRNNSLIDYFLLHIFFCISLEEFPIEWDKVFKSNNGTPHILIFELKRKFNKEKFELIKSVSPFHKLTYKIDVDEKGTDTYYEMIASGKYLAE